MDTVLGTRGAAWGEGAAGRRAAADPYDTELAGLIFQVKKIHGREGVQEWNTFCAKAGKKTYDPKVLPADFLKRLLEHHRQTSLSSVSSSSSSDRAASSMSAPSSVSPSSSSSSSSSSS